MTVKHEESKIIILGSKSFIAKSFIKEIKKKNIKIIEVSRNEIDFTDQVECLRLRTLINKNDFIFFVAARAPVKNIEMFNYNLKICNNILNAIEQLPFKHIIYLSSDAVYKDSMSLIDENSPAEPDSLHGLMHLTREKLIENLFKEKLCIVRPTLVYGKNDPHNGYGPNKFYRNALKNEDINIFGKGEEQRDHVWVEDVAEIISRVIDLEFVGKINITSGKIISFLQIAEMILDLNISSSKIRYLKRNGPMPHNGFRAFKNNKLLSIFGDFKFKDINKWFYEVLVNEN